MDFRRNFDELRVKISDMKTYMSGEEYTSLSFTQRLMLKEQLSSMEHQSVTLSEFLNSNDGLQDDIESPYNEKK